MQLNTSVPTANIFGRTYRADMNNEAITAIHPQKTGVCIPDARLRRRSGINSPTSPEFVCANNPISLREMPKP